MRKNSHMSSEPPLCPLKGTGRVLVLMAIAFGSARASAQFPAEDLASHRRGLCEFLQAAAGRNDVEGLEEQIDFGANIECRMSWDYDGATPLVIAASRGGADAVRFLIEQGAEVNARDRKGLTALGHARSGLKNAVKGSEEARKFALTIELLNQADAEE
jgi:hypothetical protein